MLGAIVTALVAAAAILPFFPRTWRPVLRWLRVLWACRVSFVSVLAGLTLLKAAPQAQDVFADTSVNAYYWVGFFVLVFTCWALPVHYAARRMLVRRDWLLPRSLEEPERSRLADDLRPDYEAAITWVPRLLGLACFGVVGIGI